MKLASKNLTYYWINIITFTTVSVKSFVTKSQCFYYSNYVYYKTTTKLVYFNIIKFYYIQSIITLKITITINLGI